MGCTPPARSRINPFLHARVATRCVSPPRPHRRQPRGRYTGEIRTHIERRRGCCRFVRAPSDNGPGYLCSLHKERRLLRGDAVFYDDSRNGRRQRTFDFGISTSRPVIGNYPSAFGLTSESFRRQLSDGGAPAYFGNRSVNSTCTTQQIEK